MPFWLQVLLWMAAGLTALGVIWQKGIKPAVRVLRQAQDTIAVMDAVVVEFKGNLHHLAVLDDIAHEFKTNNGSSLKDAIVRLEASAHKAAVAASEAKIESEANRQQIAQVRVIADRMSAMIDLGLVSNQRIESAAVVVKDELAAAQERADAEPTGEPGAAADAGFKSDPKE